MMPLLIVILSQMPRMTRIFSCVCMHRFALRDSLSGRIPADEKYLALSCLLPFASCLARIVGTFRVIPMRLCA